MSEEYINPKFQNINSEYFTLLPPEIKERMPQLYLEAMKIGTISGEDSVENLEEILTILIKREIKKFQNTLSI